MKLVVKRWLNRIDPGFGVVLLISLLAIWPFLSIPSLPQETDAELHIFRLHELTGLIAGGEWYPRWAPNFYHGYGYPIFNYYAPLTYYLALPVTLLPWFDAVDGVKVVFVLGMLLGSISLYGFVRDNWGRQAGYVATAVFLYAPYIQYIDPHARGVLPESFSFGVFPLALWSLDRLRREGTWGWWLSAVLATAAVILSHNLMALLFFGVLLAWALWQVVVRREAWHVGRKLFLALFLGLGTAAFFWLPVYLERDAVNLSTLLGQGDNYDFRTHFLSLADMFSFSQRLDWGASEPAFRFNLGVAQWLLGGMGILFLWLRRAKEAKHLLFFAVATAVLIFLMLPVSTPLWEATPVLPFFQFPWRLLGATAIMLAILAGAGTSALLEILPPAPLPFLTPSSWTTAVLISIPILFGLPLSQPAPWPDFEEVNNLRMTTIELRGRWLGTTSTADYVPVTVDTIPARIYEVVRGIEEGTALDRVNRATLPEGTTVENEYVRPLFTRYHVNASKKFRLRLFQFDFPGWQVRIDGDVVETELGRPEGFIIIPVPKGAHIVEVEFGSTPARTLAGWITAVSLLLTLIGIFLLQRTSYQLPNYPITIDDKRAITAVATITALTILILNPLGWLHYQSSGFTAQPADHSLFADLGDQIALIGYDTSTMQASAGDTLDLTLYWKAKRPLDINYQVFVHILTPDGALITQSDKLNPGDFPTRRWSPDKYVRDKHRLQLPADLPAGEYVVATGMWVQTEGWRLPLFDENEQQIGDNVHLFTLTVK